MISRRDFFKVTAAGSVLASMGYVSEAQAAIDTVLPNEMFCEEKDRKIPLIGSMDIIVVGGSSRAVAAAVSAARNGSRVFLIENMPYLGEDICGSLLFEREKDEPVSTSLGLKIYRFGEFPTPMHVKKTLEDELIDNNIQFLYSSFVTNVLLDDHKHLAGGVIANRSGRECIRCKAIIDATSEASVAKMSGAECTKFNSGEQDFYYTVVGNSTKKLDDRIIDVQSIEQSVISYGKKYPIIRYHFKYDRHDDSYASIQAAEQFIRSLTWDEDQVDSSDLLWYVPHQTIKSKQPCLEMKNSIRDIPLKSFQSGNIDSLWVLGPCAEIPRELA